MMDYKSRNPFGILMLILLFALAIGVFVGTGLACKWFFAKYIENKDMSTIVSFIIAGAVTLGFLQILKILNRRTMKDA